MRNVLVTGASGFVGRILCDQLVQCGYSVRAASRTEGSRAPGGVRNIVIGEINGTTDWRNSLEGVDLIVHAAARVHVLKDPDSPLYTETNAHGTRRLAEAAAGAGVARFVYLSSIKVNGEETPGRAYSPADTPDPQDAYGKSKWLGESALMEVAGKTAMEAVIVRPPLVYGPGVKANFLRLLRSVDKGRPLPLGAIRNRRSLVSVWNLCDLILTLLRHPQAPGRLWLVSDGEDLSTPELIRRIGIALGRRANLVPVPPGLLQAIGRLAGRGKEVSRLCGSLVVDTALTRGLLEWEPPVTVDAALARTAAWYRSESSHDR